MIYKATPVQRTAIFGLIRRCELDPQTVTMLHEPAIRAAGMRIESWIGERLAEFVGQLSSQQASRYLDALKAQAGDA